jgi:uncharacterized protein YjdB
MKLHTDFERHITVQKIGYQGFTEPGARAFIAQNKTQPMFTGVYTLTIKK